MGRFDDRATQPQRGPGDMLKGRIVDTLRGRRVRDPGGFTTPVVPNDGRALALPHASLTWIGHATFVLRLGGLLVATDPVWSQRLQGVVPRRAPPGVALDKLPPVDVVTVSHNHYDHLDLFTLKALGPKPLYVTPIGNGALLRRAGLPRVVELDWWESHAVSDKLTITCVPARHWSMRAPWNRNDALWSGFVLRAPEGVAYHAGDTALFDDVGEIGARLGPIDWAMLPIGAYEPRWFMEPQHMNPEDVGEASTRLGARNLVAMHWGTFKLTDEPLGEPPTRMRSWFVARALPAERLWVLDVGETRRLGGVPGSRTELGAARSPGREGTGDTP
jgi:L-ascorbate metabolism protein UlaG (beta-lactamase superfamily)